MHHEHHEHSDQKHVSAELLHETINLLNDASAKAKRSEATHHHAEFEQAIKHIHSCHQILTPHAPHHEEGTISISLRSLNDAYHEIRSALSSLARYKRKDEGIHQLLSDVRASEKAVEALIKHEFHHDENHEHSTHTSEHSTHRKISRKGAIRRSGRHTT